MAFIPSPVLVNLQLKGEAILKHYPNCSGPEIKNGNCKGDSKFGLRFFLLTLVLLLAFAAPVLAKGGKKPAAAPTAPTPLNPVITYVGINGSDVDINGENLIVLDAAGNVIVPTVILGRNGKKNIPVDITLINVDASADGKQIVAQLPATDNAGNPLSLLPGTHLITVDNHQNTAEFHLTVGGSSTGSGSVAGTVGPTGPTGPTGPQGVSGVNGVLTGRGDIYIVSQQVVISPGNASAVEVFCRNKADVMLSGGCRGTSHLAIFRNEVNSSSLSAERYVCGARNLLPLGTTAGVILLTGTARCLPVVP